MPEEPLSVPFTAFNFKVEITVPGLNDGNSFVCSAAFSECSGLDATMAPKTIREGGNNAQDFHLLGPVSFSQLTLKRGMTENFDLWRWFNMTLEIGSERTRGSGEILMLPNQPTGEPRARFQITGCLPVKLRAPALNAVSGEVAIEELQIAYETLRLD